MERKGIIFTAPGKVELLSREYKQPSSGECLVKVDYSLISSGTEKAQLLGGVNTLNKFPSNHGYSAVGSIVSCAKDVSSFKVGDRVFVERGGHYNFITQKASLIHHIPDSIPSEEAVFARVASFSLAAVRRSRMEIGESCAVQGLGMLGLFAVQFAKIGGAYPIFAVGNREIRKNLAAKFGADFVYSPDDNSLIDNVLRITENETSLKGVSVVIETSGAQSAFMTSLKLSGKYGRVMITGCNREPFAGSINLYEDVHKKAVQIIGVHGRSRPTSNSAPGNWTVRRDLITIFNLLKSGHLDVKSMISEFHKPEECAAVYKRLVEDKEFPLGVIFDWRK
ncbi:zinc-binding alcohol dehydrogenase [Succinimonas sp.]|uniref:zinc-dependent alcohol dehydrogenase n=1 Tax=Succinimonas sp. TaxID=1936151 RepID=UPI00386D5973